MKVSALTFLVTVTLSSYCASINAGQHLPAEKNALIIQADFTGVVMTGVAYTVSNSLYFVSPDNGSLSGPATSYGIEAVLAAGESISKSSNSTIIATLESDS